MSSPNPIRRVAIVFSGGPAPAANAVISTCAASFLRNNINVVGIRNGYSGLVDFSPYHPMEVGRDFIIIDSKILRRTRNSQGIMIGTARTNPGGLVSHPSHLDDAERVQPLQNIYDALQSLDVDALISIGGDDSLKTANKFRMFQDRLPEGRPRIPVVHLPKTIDNDYLGIDFTFGYFTAVEFLASEIHNLLFDAEATCSYFIVETMGRSAGWLAYGAAMASEASLVLSVEDIQGPFADVETIIDPDSGEKSTRQIMNLDHVIAHIVKTMLVRNFDQKPFGVVVLAEGLVELLPAEHLKGVDRDEHGHVAMAQVDLRRKFASWVAAAYEKETGEKRRVVGVQVGYESRCAKPHAFDVLLGSQLGVGAYRALVEENHDGVMVSVQGQLEIQYVHFNELVDPETLATVVRHIEPEKDFYQLARFLETNVNR